MAKEIKVTRAYDALALGDVSLNNLLSKTIDFYNGGTRVWTNMWLNLFGAMEPEFLRKSPISRYKLAKKSDREGSNRSNDKVIPEGRVPSSLILFSCWFVPESVDYAPKQTRIGTTKVWNQFREYMSQYDSPIDGTPWDATIRQTILAIDPERAVWVDRKKSFKHWNKRIEIGHNNLLWFLTHPQFPLQEEAKIKEFVRTFFTTLWGTGKKTNWPECVRLIHILESQIKDTQSQDQIREAFLREVNIAFRGETDKERESIISRLYSGQGRTDKMAKFLAGASYDSVDDLVGILKTFREIAEHNCTFENGEWSVNLRHYMESQVGTTYFDKVDGTARNEQFGVMACVAMERLLSHRKNSFNQLYERSLCLVPSDPPVSTGFGNLMTVYKNTRRNDKDEPQKFISQKQINGFGDVLALWKDCNTQEQRLESIKDAQQDYEGRFGDHHLFTYLAGHYGQNPESYNWEKCLKDYQRWDHSHNRWLHLRPPFVRHICKENNPVWPLFGVSRPPFIITYRHLSYGYEG